MRVSLWERPAQRVALMPSEEGERKRRSKKRRINELALATGPDFSIIVKKKKQVQRGPYARLFEKR